MSATDILFTDVSFTDNISDKAPCHYDKLSRIISFPLKLYDCADTLQLSPFLITCPNIVDYLTLILATSTPCELSYFKISLLHFVSVHNIDKSFKKKKKKKRNFEINDPNTLTVCEKKNQNEKRILP